MGCTAVHMACALPLPLQSLVSSLASKSLINLLPGFYFNVKTNSRPQTLKHAKHHLRALHTQILSALKSGHLNLVPFPDPSSISFVRPLYQPFLYWISQN
ncbi:hypothetical protein DFH09DRAFT_1164135 [Mycena vulgaris]|nr:hypothetical protein DFH09DRAFT_1164135 [Mycena vulgaris]